MQRLDGGDDAKLLEPRDVLRAHDLQMFNPMAAVTDAIGMLCRLETVQCLSDGRVANGMDRDLQPLCVCSDVRTAVQN